MSTTFTTAPTQNQEEIFCTKFLEAEAYSNFRVSLYALYKHLSVNPTLIIALKILRGHWPLKQMLGDAK